MDERTALCNDCMLQPVQREYKAGWYLFYRSKSLSNDFHAHTHTHSIADLNLSPEIGAVRAECQKCKLEVDAVSLRACTTLVSVC